jgi:hypothetical protein
MGKMLIMAGASALLVAGSAMAWAQTGTELPRDRQVALERHTGHLVQTGTERCVQRRRIAETVVISDQRILYRASRGLVWDATLNPGCANMARSPYLPQTLRTGSQICAGDTIEVVSPGRTASCTIAGFGVWERPAPAG